MSRHDYSAVRSVLDIAMTVGLIDAWDLAELLAEMEGDEDQGIENLCLIAYADRHSAEGQARSKAVVEAAETFWKTALDRR